MDFSQCFNQEKLSDVTLRLRSTLPVDDPSLQDEGSRKRARSEEGDPTGERFFYLHKIILFQSPYFETMHDTCLGRMPIEILPAKKKACACGGTTGGAALSANALAALVDTVEEGELPTPLRLLT